MPYTYRYTCRICGRKNTVTLPHAGVKLPVYCPAGADGKPSACQAEANRRRMAAYRKRKKAAGHPPTA